MHACRTSPNVFIELLDIHNTLWLKFDNKSIPLHCIAWKSNLYKNYVWQTYVQLSMLLLFVHLVHLNSLSITIFFLTCLIFPKRKAQSECDYWIPDMSISQCKSWLCWHDNAIASLRQRVLRLVPSWRMELNIRMKCYERTFSLIDSITEHHCSPVDYWACSIKNGHSLWSLNDI